MEPGTRVEVQGFHMMSGLKGTVLYKGEHRKYAVRLDHAFLGTEVGRFTKRQLKVLPSQVYEVTVD